MGVNWRTRGGRVRDGIAMLVLLLTAACGGHPALDPPGIAAGIDSIAARALRTGIAGLSIVVARDDSIVYDRGYGVENVASATPMSSSSVHDYYSVAKHITAAVLLHLEDQGRVDLEAPVERYLPSADLKDHRVTTLQLLRHVSGLVDVPFDETDPPAFAARSPRDGERLNLPDASVRRAPAGETWMYSNAGYVLADLVAEAAADRPFDALLAEITAPLTGVDLRHCASTTRVQEYLIADGERRMIPAIDPGWFPAPVCGTAGDLVRWWIGLRRGAVIDSASLGRMFSRTELTMNGASDSFGYGLGVRMGVFHGHEKLGHTGTGGGGSSIIAEYPNDGLVIAVVMNTAGDGIPDAIEIEAEIARAMLDDSMAADSPRPIPPGLLEAARGYYESPEGAMCVSVRDGGLARSVDGGPPARLEHVGGGRFREELGGASGEYFLGIQEGKAQWFALDVHGFPYDLAARRADSCPG